jgi:hypothetical protein
VAKSLWRSWGMVLGLTGATAFAHGLPPGTTAVTSRTSAPEDVLVATNFGPILSKAQGGHRLICAEAVGYPEGFETVQHWTASGRLLVGSATGLFGSLDGCSWSKVTGLANAGVNDLWPHPESGTIFAATGKYGAANGIWSSTDDGQSFSATPLQEANLYFTAVRSSKALPARLYASAWWYSPLSARLFVSNDAGATWTDALPTLPQAGPFFILGVSPTLPNVLFAWLSAEHTDVSNTFEWLLRSDDAGGTWSVVLKTDTIRRGLAFSDDGNTVWLSTQTRLFRSTNHGLTFAPLPSPGTNACVYRSGSSLYACGGARNDGFAVGISSDGGDTFERWMNLDQVEGILACPVGTATHDVCEPLWSTLRTQLAEAAAPAPFTFPSPRRGGCGSAPGLLWPGAAWVLAALRRKRPPLSGFRSGGVRRLRRSGEQA